MRVPERLQVVCTPLRVDCWARYLRTHPDQEFVGFLLSGMREGFRIGCDYHVVCCRGAERNMQSAEENPMMVDNYLVNECELGRVVGPLMESELKAMSELHVSRFGVIPRTIRLVSGV